MKVLLVGGGAREHAIASALKRNESLQLYAVLKNRNPGILRLCEKELIHDETDTGAVLGFAREKGVDLAFVGPEAPLAMGVADALWDAGIPCVGPRKALARIESDKEFMRMLMDKYQIGARLGFRAFSQLQPAYDYLEEVGGKVAVKPVGLTGGKGVKVWGEQLKSIAEAKAYVKEIIETGMGGGRVILEEVALGEEFTLQAFVDGSNIALMPAVQDHKRAFEGDKGPNTGGMGSYSQADHLLPFLDRSTYDEAGEVIRQTVRALKKETGEGYKGVLYGQFMIGKELKLIEFNCRFGDPEAMNVLSMLRTDLTGICNDIITGSLGNVIFEKKASVCKYVVPEGYGVEPMKNKRIMVDEEGIKAQGCRLYYAAVNEVDGGILTTSSRSLGVVGVDDTIVGAEERCERALTEIKGDHIYHRRDIGTKELIDKKLENLMAIRK